MCRRERRRSTAPQSLCRLSVSLFRARLIFISARISSFDSARRCPRSLRLAAPTSGGDAATSGRRGLIRLPFGGRRAARTCESGARSDSCVWPLAGAAQQSAGQWRIVRRIVRNATLSLLGARVCVAFGRLSESVGAICIIASPTATRDVSFMLVTGGDKRAARATDPLAPIGNERKKLNRKCLASKRVAPRAQSHTDRQTDTINHSRARAPRRAAHGSIYHF